MRTLAEFLAGCPRSQPDAGKKMPWGSLWNFPGFLLCRMYTLLARPRQAIAEFGAADYTTPFLFFLFFTITTAFLQNLVFMVSIVFLPFFRQTGNIRIEQPGISDILHTIFSNSDYLIFGILDAVIQDCLYLGMAVIILALGLWFITGAEAWNPAFSISAYCLAVSSLLFMLWDFTQIFFVLLNIPSDIADLAFKLAGVLYMAVIAGYGIAALTKIPLINAGIMALFWVIAWILLQVYGIYPVEQSLTQWISSTYFPRDFPTDAVLRNNT